MAIATGCVAPVCVSQGAMGGFVIWVSHRLNLLNLLPRWSKDAHKSTDNMLDKEGELKNIAFYIVISHTYDDVLVFI